MLIERGSLKRSGELISAVSKARKAVIITDDIVGRLYADTLCDSLEKSGISHSVFTFPNGEHSKNLSTLSDIFDFLCDENITRSDLLIALGGGVVGDITGFAAASTSFRYLPPSSLRWIPQSAERLPWT